MYKIVITGEEFFGGGKVMKKYTSAITIYDVQQILYYDYVKQNYIHVCVVARSGLQVTRTIV